MSTYTELLREAVKGQFMQPYVVKGCDLFADELDGLDLEDEGLYIRLAADGYMDATDWQGPFDTVEAAAESLYNTFFQD